MSQNDNRLPVLFQAGVLERIRRHARSSMDAEVCGVLIGRIADGQVVVEASIEGDHAARGGASVTFTQETWEHIYRIKDKQFPNQKIIGWYHSHPGFGIFLSEYDTFIHENFFSAAYQLAWVYDPHSDEEGCFVWDKGKLKRLNAIMVENSKPDEDKKPRPEPDPSLQPDQMHAASPPGISRLAERWRSLASSFGRARRTEVAVGESGPGANPAAGTVPAKSLETGDLASDNDPQGGNSKRPG